MDLIGKLHDTFGPRFREREPLSRHTNFRIGGPAAWYVEARTPDEVTAAVQAAQGAGVPWFVLGGGSNTLVSDTGFDGLIIQAALRDVRIDGTRVTAGAGAITAAVARQASEAGLTGFEWAVSLPGTIGGAVRGNAGCFGGEMRNVVEAVRVLEVSGLRSQVSGLSNAQCAFAYRHSVFKEHPEWIMLGATLALQPGDPTECRRRMAAFLTRRKTKQPLERPSAGCLFTNVEVASLNNAQREQLDALASDWRAVVHDGQLPTGWLIESLNLRGARVGGAMVSERHGNFVVNLGSATAADVARLSDEVQRRVREATGIALREEVQRVGFPS